MNEKKGLKGHMARKLMYVGVGVAAILLAVVAVSLLGAEAIPPNPPVPTGIRLSVNPAIIPKDNLTTVTITAIPINATGQPVDAIVYFQSNLAGSYLQNYDGSWVRQPSDVFNSTQTNHTTTIKFKSGIIGTAKITAKIGLSVINYTYIQVVTSAPVLTVTKTDSSDTVHPGEYFNYTITVNNTGNANAISLVVLETFDSHVSFISASPSPVNPPTNNRWNIPLLPPGNSAVIRVRVRVHTPLDTMVLVNRVNVTCTEGTYADDTEDTQVIATTQHNYTFYTGWNLFALPLQPISYTTAEDLLQSNPAYTDMVKWNGSTQTYITHPKGGPNNFAFENGSGYLLYSTATATTLVTGFAYPTAFMNLYQGWNLIGWKKTTTTAETLAASIPHCDTIVTWDTNHGRWIAHPKGGPDNFAVTKGMGVFVYLTQNTSWTN